MGQNNCQHLVGCEVRVIDQTHCRFGDIGKVSSLSVGDPYVVTVRFGESPNSSHYFTRAQIEYIPASDFGCQDWVGKWVRVKAKRHSFYNRIGLVEKAHSWANKALVRFGKEGVYERRYVSTDSLESVKTFCHNDYRIGCWVKVIDTRQPGYGHTGQIIEMPVQKDNLFLVKLNGPESPEQWIPKSSLRRIEKLFDVGDRVVFRCPESIYDGEKGQILSIDATEPEKAMCNIALDHDGTISVFCTSVTPEDKHTDQKEPALPKNTEMYGHKGIIETTDSLSMPDKVCCQSGVPKLDSLIEEANNLHEQLFKLRVRFGCLHEESLKIAAAFEEGKKAYEELHGEIQRLDDLRNTKKKIEDALMGSITRGARNVVDFMLRGGRGYWKNFEELECLCGASRVEEVVAAAVELESSLKVVEHGGQKILKVKRFF